MNIDLRDTYNRIAEAWHNDHTADDWWIEGTNTFLSMLPQGGTVLDVGCGSGSKTKYISERGCTVTGIDFSEKLLEIAREEAPMAKFALLPMENLEQLNEKFDGVFVQASLLHIPKNEAADVVKKMAEHLNPGGHLYIAVKEVKEGKPDEEIKTEDDYGYPYERFFSYFRKSELESYMAQAGLKVVWKEAKPTGRTTWLQIIGEA